MAATIPSIKLEGGNVNVKMEDASSPSAVSETYMDDADDDPELNFDEVSKMIWMSKLPKYLWETLAKASDDEEIELGTIRVEGSIDKPDRVSLMLNGSQMFEKMEKEYILKKQMGPARRVKRPGQVLMFSEKNKAGYKQRSNVWDQIDDDGNPGQGRSQLFEQALKDERKKENKGKFTPYARRPITKITALAGTVHQEFEAVPVDNAEYRKIEAERTRRLLGTKQKSDVEILDKVDASRLFGSMISTTERQNINLQARNKKQAAKENRAARMEKPALIEALFDAFREHKYWGLRDLRMRLRQPEQWVKDNLEEIAVMHRAGDFNGKWELKSDYTGDAQFADAVGEAPKMEDTDVDMKSEDEDEDFEDV